MGTEGIESAALSLIAGRKENIGWVPNCQIAPSRLWSPFECFSHYALNIWRVPF
jgi:hypothetical protein